MNVMRVLIEGGDGSSVGGVRELLPLSLLLVDEEEVEDECVLFDQPPWLEKEPVRTIVGVGAGIGVDSLRHSSHVCSSKPPSGRPACIRSSALWYPSPALPVGTPSSSIVASSSGTKGKYRD